ncbi:hypothetical protein PILCRDRAFT_815333, partial [Piloderma croceum F 1598]
MLGWFQRASLLFPFQDLPAWPRLIMIITSGFFSIVFLEITFYGIIGHNGGDLGMFGKLHTDIWEWVRFAWTVYWEWVQFAWSEARIMWDIGGGFFIRGTQVLLMLFERLCRICGVRDRQVADQGVYNLGGPGMFCLRRVVLRHTLITTPIACRTKRTTVTSRNVDSAF